MVVIRVKEPMSVKEPMTFFGKKKLDRCDGGRSPYTCQNNTWKVVDEPNKVQTSSTSNGYFKNNFGADGGVERFKAKTSPRGFCQKYGVYFLETYEVVIKMSSVRLYFCALKLAGLRLTHGNVWNAYD